jgi:hypothetical protein
MQPRLAQHVQHITLVPNIVSCKGSVRTLTANHALVYSNILPALFLEHCQLQGSLGIPLLPANHAPTVQQ